MRRIILCVAFSLMVITASSQINSAGTPVDGNSDYNGRIKGKVLLEYGEKLADCNDTTAIVYIRRSRAAFKSEGDLNGEVEAIIRLSQLHSYSNNDSSMYFDSLALGLARGHFNKDKETRALLNLAINFYNRQKYAEVQQCIQQAKDIIEKYDFKQHLPNYYLTRGLLCDIKSDIRTSLAELEQAKKYLETEKYAEHREIAAFLFVASANRKMLMGLFDEALKDVENAISMAKVYDDLADLISAYNVQGRIYSQLELTGKAINAYHTALALSISSRQKPYEAILYQNLSDISEDSTLYYAQKAIVIFESLHDCYAAGGSYIAVSSHYLKTNKRDSALACLNRLSKMECLNNPYSQCRINNNFGLYYELEKNNAEAERYYRKAYDQYLVHGVKNDLGLNIISALVRMYEKTGRPKLALEFLHQYHELKDTVYNRSMRAGIEKMEFQQEMDRKEVALQLANKEQELQSVRTRLKIFVLTLISSLLLLTVVIAFFFLRQKSRNELALKKKNEFIENLMLELNHRVKNNFQVLSGIFGLKSHENGNYEINRTLLEGKARIDAILLIHQKLSVKDGSNKINAEEYLSELLDNIIFEFEIEPAMVFKEFRLKDKYFHIKQLVPLALIINELVTNAFKHAFTGNSDPQLRIVLTEDDDGFVSLMLKDNGPASDQEINKENKNTIGLFLVDDFAQQINARIQYTIDNGLKWMLRFNRYEG